MYNAPINTVWFLVFLTSTNHPLQVPGCICSTLRTRRKSMEAKIVHQCICSKKNTGFEAQRAPVRLWFPTLKNSNKVFVQFLMIPDIPNCAMCYTKSAADRTFQKPPPYSNTCQKASGQCCVQNQPISSELKPEFLWQCTQVQDNCKVQTMCGLFISVSLSPDNLSLPRFIRLPEV